MKMSFKHIIGLLMTLLLTLFLLNSCAFAKPPHPTEEEVLSCISQASQKFMAKYYLLDEDAGRDFCGYFFNENCTSKILEESIDDTAEPPTYTAILESKRIWKNVEVTEKEEVHLVYNSEAEGWNLVDYVILDLEAAWNVDGEYQTDSGAKIVIEAGEYVNGGSEIDYFEDDYIYSNYTKALVTLTTEEGKVYAADWVRLYTPCSKGIFPGYANYSGVGFKMEPGEEINVMVTIANDWITYKDLLLPEEMQKNEVVS